MGVYYDEVKELMSDGKPRTAPQIRDELGYGKGICIGTKMKLWEKYGVCKRVGTVKGITTNKLDVWQWVE